MSEEGEEGALLSLGPGDEMFYTFFVPNDRAFSRVNQVKGWEGAGEGGRGGKGNGQSRGREGAGKVKGKEKNGTEHREEGEQDRRKNGKEEK